MSFDVVFQGFHRGEPAPGGGEAALRLLEPLVVEGEPTHGCRRISLDGATADIYLSEDSMMVSRVSSRTLWEPLVQAARAANWTIIPVGCAMCYTDESQRGHLPEWDDGYVFVANGQDLAAVVEKG